MPAECLFCFKQTLVNNYCESCGTYYPVLSRIDYKSRANLDFTENQEKEIEIECSNSVDSLNQ